MTLRTRLARPALLAGLLAATASLGGAQPPGPTAVSATPVGADLTRIAELKSGKLLVTGADEAVNKALLTKFARFYATNAYDDKYYALPTGTALAPRKTEDTFDSVISEMNQRLVVPTPEVGLANMRVEQGVYLNAFGDALDAAIGEVLQKPNQRAIVRVNAMRLFAAASASGAKAHGRTILAMLKNQYFKEAGKPAETPPEVLIWALHAAENLLAARDLQFVGSKTAANRHVLAGDELAQLANVLDEMIVKGPPVASKAAPAPAAPAGPVEFAEAGAPAAPKDAPPAAGPTGNLEAKPLTPEQRAVVLYYRKQAVRALSKFRTDTVVGRAGTIDARPGFTLARVATDDITLSLPTTPAEAAEAFAGICNLASPSNEINLDEMVRALAESALIMARPKSADDGDKSLPWRYTAGRLTAASANLTQLAQSNPRWRQNAGAVAGVLRIVQSEVLQPLSVEALGGTGKPQTEGLVGWLSGNPPKDAARNLYTDSPKYQLKPRPPGN